MEKEKMWFRDGTLQRTKEDENWRWENNPLSVRRRAKRGIGRSLLLAPRACTQRNQTLATKTTHVAQK